MLRPSLLLFLLFSVDIEATAQSANPCWLIRDVTLVDGTGTPGRAASVRVCGDRIAAVGQLQPRDG
ncbi:MAG TPA: hypothetical protein VIC28_06495, partial [Thermoanaerobaculia bacterium]